jgi:predicted nuclease with TOPRIM domain
VGELKERLTELQGKYNHLNELYESLQLKYSTVEQELETLRRGNSKHESVSSTTRSYRSDSGEWEEFCGETYPLLFDGLAFYNHQDLEKGRGAQKGLY